MISAGVKLSGDELRGIVKDAVRDATASVTQEKEAPGAAASRALQAEIDRQNDAIARADRKSRA